MKPYGIHLIFGQWHLGGVAEQLDVAVELAVGRGGCLARVLATVRTLIPPVGALRPGVARRAWGRGWVEWVGVGLGIR